MTHGSKLLALPSRTVPGSVAHLPKGGRASGSPLTVAGSAADLAPDQRSSRDARRSLLTGSRGTIDP